MIYSKERRENISKGLKKYFNENIRPPMSKETRDKISQSQLGRKRLYIRKPIGDLKMFHRIRERLFELRGRKCELCGWDSINVFSKIIPVQVHHIDGDKKNNDLTNLVILCPNCHSLTEGFMFYGRKHIKRE